MGDARGDDTTSRDAAASRKRRAEASRDAGTAEARDSRHELEALCEALDAMSRRSRPGACAGVMADMPNERDVDAWLRARDGTWDVEVEFVEATSEGRPLAEPVPTRCEEEVCRFDGRPGRSAIRRLTIENFVAIDGVLNWVNRRVCNADLAYGAQIPMSALGSSSAYDAVSSWTPKELREYFERKGVSAEQTHMWMNRRSIALTNWHYDNYDNVLTVCTGRKIVRMRAPAFYFNRFPRDLHPFAAGTESSNHFPDANYREGDRDDDDCDLQVTLGHGDSVFIPSGWYHCVESAPNTLAISRWWVNDFNTNLNNSIFTDDSASSTFETPLGAIISGRYNLYHFRRAFERALDGVVESMGLPLPQKGWSDPAHNTLPLRRDGSHNLFGTALNGILYQGVNDCTEFEFAVRALGREILKVIMNTRWFLCNKFNELESSPLSFISLLQEARYEALVEGDYRLAHRVDFIWRELERHAENDPSWDWSDFYLQCETWSNDWEKYYEWAVLNSGRKRIKVYDIKYNQGAKQVVQAVIRNQRLAVAYQTSLLLQQTLDRGFKIEITVPDDEEIFGFNR